MSKKCQGCQLMAGRPGLVEWSITLATQQLTFILLTVDRANGNHQADSTSRQGASATVSCIFQARHGWLHMLQFRKLTCGASEALTLCCELLKQAAL